MVKVRLGGSATPASSLRWFLPLPGPSHYPAAAAIFCYTIIGVMRALNRDVERVFDTSRKDTHWGRRKLKRGPEMTVLIYVNTSKQVGDADHLKVFASADAMETWLEENDPEGVAFEYEVLE
jgi:hypothetical protein